MLKQMNRQIVGIAIWKFALFGKELNQQISHLAMSILTNSATLFHWTAKVLKRFIE